MQHHERQKRKEAAIVLRALALGIHPFTGEPIEEPGVLHESAVIRATILGAEALRILSGDAKPDGALPSKEKLAARTGNAWSAEEDDELRDEFARKVPIKNICAAHGRSAGGIASRLVRLKLVEEREDARRIFREPPLDE